MSNGVRFSFIKNSKFKTSMIGVYFSTPLTAEKVSVNALVPAVLRRGTNNYPTMKDISRKLQLLYGAKFDCGVSKKGENQIIRFYGEVINKRYTKDNEDVLSQLADIIYDVITNPVLENNKFKSDYISQEKAQVKDIIESRKNDKVQYALERCYELMFQNEPFGLCEFGTTEMIDKVTDEELMASYNDMLNNYQVDVVVSGDITEEEYQNIISKFKFNDRESLSIVRNSEVHVDEVRNHTEKFDINQAKLSLGYRVNIDTNTDDYYKMLVYNGILGGGVQSKLFQNVREKYSLAYYAFSRYEKIKSVMGISCGIEIPNYQKALDTILEQVEDIKNGNISDYEYETTIKTIENSLNSMRDEQYQMLDFNYTQILMGSNKTLEEIIENVKKVTKEDVIYVSKFIELDTIYFMTGNESSEGDEA